ncbi:MAG: response regulator [Lachnospiraceae bacterium]|nr:response regulator [Lachnospiraceae bacterium]
MSTRYKMLVTGKNDMIIDDIFALCGDMFEVLTCSDRYADRVRHIDLLLPQIFCICLNGETREEMAAYSGIKRKLTSRDVMAVLIGSKEECEAFQSCAIQVADLILTRPITADKIKQEICDALDEKEQEKEAQAELLAKLEAVKKSEERKHVLVVDDDPMMLKVVKTYFADDYAVATAVSGKIALKFLESRKTNMILLDYEMPEENGVEVLKKIRENESLADIPVVFLTGVTDKAKLLDAISMKPQGFLLKPVDKEKLLGTVEKFIG